MCLGGDPITDHDILGFGMRIPRLQVVALGGRTVGSPPGMTATVGRHISASTTQVNCISVPNKCATVSLPAYGPRPNMFLFSVFSSHFSL